MARVDGVEPVDGERHRDAVRRRVRQPDGKVPPAQRLDVDRAVVAVLARGESFTRTVIEYPDVPAADALAQTSASAIAVIKVFLIAASWLDETREPKKENRALPLAVAAVAVPGFDTVFACCRRSWASERPTSSTSLNRPCASRRTKRLSPLCGSISLPFACHVEAPFAGGVLQRKCRGAFGLMSASGGATALGDCMPIQPKEPSAMGLPKAR